MKTSRARLPWVVTIAGLLATGWVALALHRSHHHEVELQREREADRQASLLSRELHAHLDGLRLVRAGVESSDQEFAAAWFRALARQWTTSHPAVRAVEWAPRVPRAERQAYEGALANALGRPTPIVSRDGQGAPVRAPDAAAYYPVTFVEPLRGNEAAVGYDLHSEPTRAAAIEASIAADDVRATGRIELVQDAERQSAFLLFAPIRASAGAGAVRGSLLAVLRVPDLVGSAFASALPSLDMEVRDLSAAGATLVGTYDADGRRFRGEALADSDGGVATERSVDVGGRLWRLSFRPSATFAARAGTSLAFIAALVGLVLTYLVASRVRLVVLREQGLAALVAQRTAALTSLNEAISGFSAARSEEDAYGLFLRALVGGGAAVGARICQEGLASGVVLAAARSESPPALAASVTGLLDAAVTSAPRPTAGHCVLRRVEGGAPLSSVRCRLSLDGALFVEVFLLEDGLGGEDLVGRLPRLAELLTQTLHRIGEQRRFERLFESSPDALLLLAADGALFQHNPVASRFWSGLERGGSAPSQVAAAVRGATDERGAPSGTARVFSWQMEIPSGELLDLEASVGHLELPTGRYALVAVRDATARRSAERALQRALGEVTRSLAEREILLKEVHHRVKNNLQIISSLLGMQAERTESAEARVALEEGEHRVRSMALIHQLLYSGRDLASVDIGEFARTLAAELREGLAEDAELTLELESVPLTVEQAIPCGLVLNELITNALKHGVSRDGRCHLRVAVGPEGSALRIAVADQGPGFPEGAGSRRAGSLGMKIVDALVW